MAELSKDLIGQKLDKFSFTVERGKVKEFCQAIGETNPIYSDVTAAKDAGFKDTPIPPTFQTAFVFWGFGYENFWTALKNMGIDTERLLHLKEEYTYHETIYPGETIAVQGEVVDVKTGKMEMVTMKNTYTKENGDVCLEAEMSIVMRPEGM